MVSGDVVNVSLNLVPNQAAVIYAPNPAGAGLGQTEYWVRCLPPDFPALQVNVAGPSSPGWTPGVLLHRQHLRAATVRSTPWCSTATAHRSGTRRCRPSSADAVNVELLGERHHRMDGRLRHRLRLGQRCPTRRSTSTRRPPPPSRRRCRQRIPTSSTLLPERRSDDDLDPSRVARSLGPRAWVRRQQRRHDAGFGGGQHHLGLRGAGGESRAIKRSGPGMLRHTSGSTRSTTVSGQPDAGPPWLLDFGQRRHRAADIYHCNSVAVDEDTSSPYFGDVLVSMRHLNAVFLIDRTTGDVIWKMGGTSFTPNDPEVGAGHPGAAPRDRRRSLRRGFCGQHDARFVADAEPGRRRREHLRRSHAMHRGGPRRRVRHRRGCRHRDTGLPVRPAPRAVVPGRPAASAGCPIASNAIGSGSSIIGWGIAEGFLSGFTEVGRRGRGPGRHAVPERRT